MTEYTVGRGGDFTALATAAAAVKPGDVVSVLSGIYRESLALTTPDVTWRGAPGAVIDNGYSAAAFTGQGLKKKLPHPAAEKNALSIRAAGIVIDGLTIQNVPGHGIGIAASDVTVRDCNIYFTYNSAILSNVGKGERVKNLLIEGNTCVLASMQFFDPLRSGGGPAGVGGVMKFGNCLGNIVIRDNHLAFGFGEGLNFGKFNVDKAGRNVISGNEIHDCNHTHLYVNRSAGVDIVNNLVYTSEYLLAHKAAGQVPIGISVTDEQTFATFSRDVRVVGNIVVGMSRPLVGSIQDQGAGTQTGIVFDHNTLVASGNSEGARPATQKLLLLDYPGPVGVTVTNNLFYRSVASYGLTNSKTPAGVTFGHNLWPELPPVGWRGAGDVKGDARLVDPDRPIKAEGPYPEYVTDFDEASYMTDIDPDNYGLTADSPARGAASGGGDIGAMAGGTEPTDPPDEPAPDVDIDELERIFTEIQAGRAQIGAAARDLRAFIDELRG